MIACLGTFFFLNVFSQTIYYAVWNSVNSTTCGSIEDPCGSIDQIVFNYPGVSCTINIGKGTFVTGEMLLGDNAVIVFQGIDFPTILASWRTLILMTNSKASASEFRNLSISMIGALANCVFTRIYDGNSIGFYDSEIIGSDEDKYRIRSSVVSLYGGSVIISNVTVANAIFRSYFIVDRSDNDDSNITITGSTFTNLSIGTNGSLLAFDAFGAANIIINSSTFNGISSEYMFIGFWAEDYNQVVCITNNNFCNINTYLPSIYIENDFDCVIYISDSTWINSTAEFVSGAVETLGYDKEKDHNITFNNLVFKNCRGSIAGTILVGYNSLNVSGSNFSGNSGDKANDLVQAIDSYGNKLGYSITKSFSTSDLPKAVIDDAYLGYIDISEALPFPAETVPIAVRTLTRKEISASPKFGRKSRKI